MKNGRPVFLSIGIVIVLMIIGVRCYWETLNDVAMDDLIVPLKQYSSRAEALPLPNKERQKSRDDSAWTITWQDKSSEREAVRPFAAFLVQKHNNVALSIFRYFTDDMRSFTRKKGIFYPPTSCDSALAANCMMACSVPNAGNYCRVIARYGQYVITFQMDVQKTSLQNEEFLAVWENVDHYISSQLAHQSVNLAPQQEN